MISIPGNFDGELYMRGYITTAMVNEAFCENDCDQFECVFFVPTEIGNPNFQNFLEENGDNSYVDQPSIGLGCLKNTVIRHENHADACGAIQQTLDTETTNRLMDTSEEDPVTLKLTNLELSTGSGASTCYSHFTEIELFTSEDVDSTE